MFCFVAPLPMNIWGFSYSLKMTVHAGRSRFSDFVITMVCCSPNSFNSHFVRFLQSSSVYKKWFWFLVRNTEHFMWYFLHRITVHNLFMVPWRRHVMLISTSCKIMKNTIPMIQVRFSCIQMSDQHAFRQLWPIFSSIWCQLMGSTQDHQPENDSCKCELINN